VESRFLCSVYEGSTKEKTGHNININININSSANININININMERCCNQLPLRPSRPATSAAISRTAWYDQDVQLVVAFRSYSDEPSIVASSSHNHATSRVAQATLLMRLRLNRLLLG
jgi:hypothetical protein